MNIVDKTVKRSRESRVEELERRLQGARPSGDFEGSVTGYWDKLDDRGVGLVTHNGKTYKTRAIGFLSLPKGTEVELTYANGIYYSKF